MKSSRIPRPISSFPIRTKNSPRHLRVNSAESNIFSTFKHKKPLTSRPKTSMKDINKMILFNKSKKDAKLDVLNLIIETNPKKLNLDKISNKIKKINPIFTDGTLLALQSPKFSRNTKETYYKYNILYGTESNNLIRTYSPKMRPMSSSISLFRNNMVFTEDIDYYVFNEREIENLALAKCKDIGIEVRKNMTYKLKELCKAKCKNRKVDFSQNNLGYYSCRIIAKIILKEDRISVLNLSNNNIGNKGAELIANAIKNTVSLVSLNLSSNSITHIGGEYLFKSLKLQESIIDFNISSSEGTNRNRISYFGLSDIENVFCYNLFLENFNISGNGIKNEGISKICDGLNKNQTIHLLDISHNDISSAGIENSFTKLKICKLIELNISENRFGDDGLIILTNALKNFPKIHILKIANCGFEFKGFLFLCSHLIDMKRITTLDVSGNDIKSRKFEQIKQYFMGFGVINLNISNCSLGDKSSYILGECLCLNETIKKVKICENKISDNGFRTFIPLFKTNSTIENFDISRNFITDESAEEFIENIRYNRNLKHLNLFDNQLKNEMGNLLVDILSHNKTLLTVNVGFNRIPIKVIDEINKKLKVNEEKLKSKFIPNLVKQIKENNIHPEMFRFLTKKIKHSQTYQSYISEKLKEDEVMFKQLKIEESDKLKNANKLNENLEINIKKYDLQLKIVIAEIKKLKDQIKLKSNEINELIEKLKEDIKNKTITVHNLSDNYEKIKDELEYNLNQTEAQAKLSREKIELAKISLNSLNRELKKKEDYLENGIKMIKRNSSIIKSPRKRSSMLIGSPIKKRTSIAGVDNNNNEDKKNNEGKNDILVQLKNEDDKKGKKKIKNKKGKDDTKSTNAGNLTNVTSK